MKTELLDQVFPGRGPGPHVFELRTITPPEMKDYRAKSLNGDVVASNVLKAVLNSLLMIPQVPPHERLSCLCLDCNHEFSAGVVPQMFVVIIPMFAGDGDTMFACGICGCCSERSDLREQIELAIRNSCNDAEFMVIGKQ